MSAALRNRFGSAQAVPHGTALAVNNPAPLEQILSVTPAPDLTALTDLAVSDAELVAWAREVEALCPWIMGKVPPGFVGPPVSGLAKLTRLA